MFEARLPARSFRHFVCSLQRGNGEGKASSDAEKVSYF